MALEKAAVDEHAFLGEEFLVWLWFRSETAGGVFDLGHDERVGIALDRALDFHDSATGVKVAVRGDAPTRAPEAREALSRGMRLVRAGLVVTVDQQNVTLVLDGPSLDLRSVKSEKPAGENADERDQNALAGLFGLVHSLDQVWKAFLAERLAPAFGKETAPALLQWARSATQARRGSRRAREREAAAE